MPKSSKRKRRDYSDDVVEERRKKSKKDVKRKTHDSHMKRYLKWSKSARKSASEPVSAEEAIMRAHHQFLRDDDADAEAGEKDWKVRMAVRYYHKLFKEYALADFSRYEEGKVGLRWRTEREVVQGKGQFVCGNKICDVETGLESYEVLFAYVEQGEKKNCLVKLRVCPACALKLFHKKIQEIRKQSSSKSEASVQEEISRMLEGKQVEEEDEESENDEEGSEEKESK